MDVLCDGVRGPLVVREEGFGIEVQHIFVSFLQRVHPLLWKFHHLHGVNGETLVRAVALN